MSTLFLTEDTTFICSQALVPPVGVSIKCSDSDNRSKQIKSATLLTTGAKVSSANGFCARLTQLANGTPQQCSCKLLMWEGASTKCSSKGSYSSNALLTTDSYFRCPIGQGKVSVSPTWLTHVKTGSARGSVSKGEARTIEPIASESQPASENAALGQPGSTAAVGAVVPTPSGQQTANTQGTQPQETQARETESKSEKEKERKKADSKLFCPIDRRTSKCKECGYPNTSTMVDNNSITLRRNWENAIPAPSAPWDEHHRKLLGEFGHSKWGYAAHHIISGMQVFKPNIEIVRLANFCGYDINNADNCIMLVSNTDDYGNRIGGKSVDAFDSMLESRTQWHVGGHSYKFDKLKNDELIQRIKYLTKQSPSAVYGASENEEPEIKCYAQLLAEELEKIKTSMSQNKVCRNTPDQKAAFLERIAALTSMVEKKLGSFQEKRTHSFPYYVSQIAFEYAFGLPRTAKMVLASCGNGGSIRLEKFRVTRFTRTDDGLSFNEIASGKIPNPSSFNLGTYEGRKQAIIFCENINYFVLASDVKKEDLAFMVNDQSKIDDQIFVLPDKPQSAASGSKFLGQWQSEIIVWLNNAHKSYAYTSPIQKVKERLARLDKGGL